MRGGETLLTSSDFRIQPRAAACSLPNIEWHSFNTTPRRLVEARRGKETHADRGTQRDSNYLRLHDRDCSAIVRPCFDRLRT